MGIVTNTVEYRKKNSVTRNDFMQQLIQLMDQGYVHDVDDSEKDKNEGN